LKEERWQHSSMYTHPHAVYLRKDRQLGSGLLACILVTGKCTWVHLGHQNKGSFVRLRYH